MRSSRDSHSFSHVDKDYVSKKTIQYDPTYAKPILHHKFKREKPFILKNVVFGSIQKNVNCKDYESLCSKLFQVCLDECLQTRTFALAMHLLSVALSKASFMRVEFELVCCTCLLIASKMEDICPPMADYLVIAFGRRYSKDSLIRMEQRLLAEAFKLDVSIPTRLEFLSFFVTAGNLSNKEKSLAEYIMELSYIDFNFNYFASSQVSAAAVHLTLQLLRLPDEEVWPNSLMVATGYTEEDIVEVVLRLRNLHWRCEELKAQVIVDKYLTDETFYVAEIAAISYSNLRFDSLKLAKKESHSSLWSYCEVKTNPIQRTDILQMKRSYPNDSYMNG